MAYRYSLASILKTATALLILAVIIGSTASSQASSQHTIGLGVMEPRAMSVRGVVEFTTVKEYLGKMLIVYSDGHRMRILVPGGARIKIVLSINDYKEVFKRSRRVEFWINPSDPYPTIRDLPVEHLIVRGKDYCVEGCIIKRADLKIVLSSVTLSVHVLVPSKPSGITTLIVDGKYVMYRKPSSDRIRVDINDFHPIEFGIEFIKKANGVTNANAWVQGVGHVYVNGEEVPVFNALGLIASIPAVLLASMTAYKWFKRVGAEERS